MKLKYSKLIDAINLPCIKVRHRMYEAGCYRDTLNGPIISAWNRKSSGIYTGMVVQLGTNLADQIDASLLLVRGVKK